MKESEIGALTTRIQSAREESYTSAIRKLSLSVLSVNDNLDLAKQSLEPLISKPEIDPTVKEAFSSVSNTQSWISNALASHGVERSILIGICMEIKCIGF